MINLDSDAEISKRAVTEYNISINMPLDIFKEYLFTFIKSSAKIVWKIFIGADYNATYKYVIHHTL